MFQVYGVHGRLFAGTLDELRRLPSVTAAARVRHTGPIASSPDPLGPRLSEPPPAGVGGAGRRALEAYGEAVRAPARHPLSRVADVMRAPAHTVTADASLLEAWRMLARHRIGQAPVIDGRGILVGLVGRADLLPVTWLERPATDPAAAAGLLSRRVSEVMWTPVPSVAPDTDLRRVASLLLDLSLPGVPVADEGGHVAGFVSRTDLLRALASDPPLDLWT